MSRWQYSLWTSFFNMEIFPNTLSKFRWGKSLKILEYFNISAFCKFVDKEGSQGLMVKGYKLCRIMLEGDMDHRKMA